MEKISCKLVDATRKTSHLRSLCSVAFRDPEMGKDFGLANLIIYSARLGEEPNLKVMKVFYEDGYTFGEVLVSVKEFGGHIWAHHISQQNPCWTMVFDKI